jgi:type II secretory pathway pseudopilin PulG
MTELIAVAIVVLLAFGVVAGFVGDKANRIAREDLLASNARVLREFQRMVRRDPRCIVDVDGMDRHRWDD